MLAWPDRFRSETSVGAEFERLAIDGSEAWYESHATPAHQLEGAPARSALEGSTFARFGDWRSWASTLQVIQRLERDGKEIFLVRAGDTSGPATTLYVEPETGRVVHVDGMIYAENVGRAGQRVTFSDFRDVSGVRLPFRSEMELAVPNLGEIVLTVQEVDAGVELAADAFVLRE
ncbi:MAG: hypothetical protein GY711_29185 [bacterium]|nr:hypothetical protein [bacterium]